MTDTTVIFLIPPLLTFSCAAAVGGAWLYEWRNDRREKRHRAEATDA